jgi:uncharacterized protein (DUF952 family)
MVKYVKIAFLLLPFYLLSQLCFANDITSNLKGESTMVAPHVYKIMTLSDWQESQKLGFVKPSTLDLESKFLHLSEDHQVQRTIDKFMKNEKNIIVLELEPSKFVGKLVKEKNPGGSAEYYHLYDGKIPLEAVVKSKTAHVSVAQTVK